MSTEIAPTDYGPLFLLAVSLDGDLARTAQLANVPLAQLEEVAKVLGWQDRLAALHDVRDTDGPDAMARELNRQCNFQQAQRGRDLLDKALDHFAGRPVEDLTTVSTEKTTNHSAKVLVDLVKAIETVQNLTYRALGDTATERTAESRLLGPSRLAAASGALAPGQALAQALDDPASVPEPAASKPPKPKGKAKALPFYLKRKPKRKAPGKARNPDPTAKMSDALDKLGESSPTPEAEPNVAVLVPPRPPAFETF